MRPLAKPRPIVLALSAALFLPSLATFAQNEIEIIRGTERTVERDASKAAPERQRREEKGVEILYGIEPGSQRATFDTDRYSLSATARSELRRDINQMIRVYRTVLDVRVGRRFQVDLAIMGDRDDYQRKLGSDRSNPAFYSHEARKAFVSGGGSAAAVRESIRHESSHAILMDQIPNVPRWLNEGLAEYFEVIEESNGTATIRGRPELIAYLEAARRNGRLLTLSQLFRLTPDWSALGAEGEALAYAHSWSLVAFLMQTTEGQRTLRNALTEIRRGNLPKAESTLRDLTPSWTGFLSTGARTQRF